MRMTQSLSEPVTLRSERAGGGGGGGMNAALSRRSRADIIELNDNQQRAPKDERVSDHCVSRFDSLCFNAQQSSICLPTCWLVTDS